MKSVSTTSICTCYDYNRQFTVGIIWHFWQKIVDYKVQNNSANVNKRHKIKIAKGKPFFSLSLHHRWLHVCVFKDSIEP